MGRVSCIVCGFAVIAALAIGLAPARADTSKVPSRAVYQSPKAAPSVRDKRCCGYPLSESLGFALRFYWLAMERRFAGAWDEPAQDVYTSDGFYLGTFSEPFVRELRMEGSGVLSDGRVINYDGRCVYGVGTCFETLDPSSHPYGRGAGRRPLVPFRSVAVDPRIIPIGEPLYLPELDGLVLPDGTVHDGCVRADDTGSAIKRRKIDFFVVSRENFRDLLAGLWHVTWITPHIEAPRCAYLRQS
ncbi:3D domain-containing protein [Haliangium sp.]|uniref:3D domain-containing protein n=1 Tax=Haliangium sp. TaxID=2663208 RepID=UPI003D1531D5